MKLQVYTILDSAVGAFLQPFFCRTKGEAVRSFSDAVNDEKSTFNKHVMDYTLFALAEFDDASGAFTSLPAPERVIGALEVLSVDDVFPPSKRIDAPN